MHKPLHVGSWACCRKGKHVCTMEISTSNNPTNSGLSASLTVRANYASGNGPWRPGGVSSTRCGLSGGTHFLGTPMGGTLPRRPNHCRGARPGLGLTGGQQKSSS